MTSHAQSRGHCRVLSGEKWLGEAGGATAVCSVVEHAIASAAPKARFSAEVQAFSRSRLSATLIVNGRALPEQKFAVMDGKLSIEAIRRFATSLGEAARAASH